MSKKAKTEELDPVPPSPEELQKMIDSGDYWVLEAMSSDWLFVLNRLIKARFKDEKLPVMIFGMDSIIFLLDKSRVPVEELAERLGSTSEVLTASTLIRLWPLEQPPMPKAPTVPYSGSA